MGPRPERQPESHLMEEGRAEVNVSVREKIGNNTSGLGFSPPAPSFQKKSGFAGGRQFLCVPKTDFCQITENEQQIKIQFWWLEPHLRAALQTTCWGETRLGGFAQVKTWHICPLVVCSWKDTSFLPLGHYTACFSSVQPLSGAPLFVTPWTAACC